LRAPVDSNSQHRLFPSEDYLCDIGCCIQQSDAYPLTGRQIEPYALRKRPYANARYTSKQTLIDYLTAKLCLAQPLLIGITDAPLQSRSDLKNHLPN